jgi:glycosyltransferase involved in cell wall biosynthesis
MTEKVAQARRESSDPIIWVAQILPREDLVPLYSQAALFVCPSVYEPFGIINLEAMACGTPVVASAVGGIREVVVPGETGLLVPFESRGGTDFEPKDAERFARDLAEAVNSLQDDPQRRAAMGQRARERVERFFSWPSVARRTCDFYRELVEAAGGPSSPADPGPARVPGQVLVG